jgi:hypothetical protein
MRSIQHEIHKKDTITKLTIACNNCTLPTLRKMTQVHSVRNREYLRSSK